MQPSIELNVKKKFTLNKPVYVTYYCTHCNDPFASGTIELDKAEDIRELKGGEYRMAGNYLLLDIKSSTCATCRNKG